MSAVYALRAVVLILNSCGDWRASLLLPESLTFTSLLPPSVIVCFCIALVFLMTHTVHSILAVPLVYCLSLVDSQLNIQIIISVMVAHKINTGLFWLLPIILPSPRPNYYHCNVQNPDTSCKVVPCPM